MKGFFRSRGFKMLAVAVVILAAAIAYTAGIGGFSSITSSIVGIFTTPMQGLATEGSDKLDELLNTDGEETMQSLREENEELLKELAHKNNMLVDYYEIKRENEQLRRYLDLKDQNNDWEFAPATVVGRDPNDVFYGFTINKGTLAGVQAGDPVMTENGLVGRVSKVGATYAKVITLFHPDIGVAGMSARTGDSGVVVGDKKLADEGYVAMNYLDPEATIEQGDLIVTSGMGGVFPANVVIGTVAQLRQGDRDISLTALLEPAEQIKDVKEVFVLTSFVGQGEVMDALDE